MASEKTEYMTERSTYEGYPTFKIFETEDSVKVSKYPLVSFGLKKAKAIIAALPEIEKFIKENSNGK